jgi:hypothetical protein
MIKKQIDAISKSDIDELIANSVNESKTLEYKQELPGNSDKDKKEFLADVSSFANASGGDILYGVKAAVDVDGKKTGGPETVLPIAGATADEAKLRLEEIVRNGISPRLRIQIQEISGWGDDGQGFVILLRILKSFASPHVVAFKGGSRFYSRHSAGKYPLDVDELRSAFLATDSQAERIRRFRLDRLGKIIADETPVLLSTPHRLVLHMIPITSFLNNSRLELSNSHSLTTSFPPLASGGWSRRYNLDGFVTHSTDSEDGQRNHSYCQLFFNGAVEAVYSDLLDHHRGAKESDGVGGIASVAYEKDVIASVKRYINGYKELGLDAPLAISVAILCCKGAFLYVDPSRMAFDGVRPIDRNTAILPEVIVESLDADVPTVMKPIFDSVWNACGYARSFNYDDDGQWNPRR